MKNILITGASSGLGEALAKKYLENGDNVYAIGKSMPKKLERSPHFFFFPYDLSKTFILQASIKEFVEKHSFDLVILNAGILGEIQELNQTDLILAKEVMEINLWANKELIDLLSIHSHVKQVIGISSGAALNGSKGWGSYALSKAALNMLFSIYAKELPEIHFTALAPGVVRTPMVEHIMNEVDDTLFPSVKRLKSGPIQTPQEAANLLISIFPKLLSYESGSFVDVRTMD